MSFLSVAALLSSLLVDAICFVGVRLAFGEVDG